MSNNRETRRKLARISGRRPAKPKEGVCKLCCYVIDQLVAHRAKDYVDMEGRLVELLPMDRLLPPYGLRFPRSKAARHTCSCHQGYVLCDACEGRGWIIEESACAACSGSGKIRHEACEGTGVIYELQDFAPLCQLCSQFLMAWLKIREDLHTVKIGQKPNRIRIILPQAQPRTQGGILLPGR